MAVAAIAWRHLDPSAKQRVAALLPLNPYYAAWTKDVAASDQVETAFIRAATWPDAIKKDDAYQDDGPVNGNEPPPSGPEAEAARRNIGYGDHLRHKYWHFIDQPFSPDGTTLVQPKSPNARTQIAAFRAALKSPGNSDDIKSYDLVWLEHLVGDIHQPLHAASRFTRDRPNGDLGGGLVALCAAPDCRDNLHLLWDALIGTGMTVAEAQADATAISQGRFTPAPSSDEKAWIAESFAIAQVEVYTGIGKAPVTLDDAYRANALLVAHDRVWLAGNRLAELLNDALK